MKSSASSGDGASRSCINHLNVGDGHTRRAQPIIGGAAPRLKGALQERALQERALSLPYHQTSSQRPITNVSQARARHGGPRRSAVAFFGQARPGGGFESVVELPLGGRVSDQVIRENPASRGTETSAEVLVGPPWRMVSNAGQQQWYGGYPCTPDGGPMGHSARSTVPPPPSASSVVE